MALVRKELRPNKEQEHISVVNQLHLESMKPARNERKNRSVPHSIKPMLDNAPSPAGIADPWFATPQWTTKVCTCDPNAEWPS
jgi:hypothetical protein